MVGTAVVSSRGAQRWKHGHPWIFRSDVSRVSAEVAGAVRVTDQRGAPVGVALYSPKSEIALRMVDADADAVLDDAWWERRLGAAVRRRQPVSTVASAYRLVHGEGDAIPSLVCDRYGDLLVVQLLSAGLEAFRDLLVRQLVALTGAGAVLARNDVGVREREGLVREVTVLHGDVPEVVEVHEHGVRYLVAPRTGQKTGAFLDQRENRHRFGALASSAGAREALDCFSYHGSFALHLARVVERVVALDSSSTALERARENAALNGLSNVEPLEADAFDFLKAQERERRRFDAIVLDPPAFAKTRASVEKALLGYHEINVRAMRLLSPGGLLYTASCSFHVTKSMFLGMLERAARDSGRRLVLRELLGQPIDHPELLAVPETGYLKGAIVEAL
jgi:23S rRNA (cytosine1962-C5)-methyltransferase